MQSRTLLVNVPNCMSRLARGAFNSVGACTPTELNYYLDKI